MDNECIFLAKNDFKSVAVGDTIIVNYQLSIVHFLHLPHNSSPSVNTSAPHWTHHPIGGNACQSKAQNGLFRSTILLRCPTKSSGLRFSSILSTAATRSPPVLCHRQWSGRSPIGGNACQSTAQNGLFRRTVLFIVPIFLYPFIKHPPANQELRIEN